MKIICVNWEIIFKDYDQTHTNILFVTKLWQLVNYENSN